MTAGWGPLGASPALLRTARDTGKSDRERLDALAEHVAAGPGPVPQHLPFGKFSKVQLDYTATTDLEPGTPIAANVWRSCGPTLFFDVDEVQSTVFVMVSKSPRGTGSAGVNELRTRVVLDGTRVHNFGGPTQPAGGYTSFLVGSGLATFGDLTTTRHSVRLDLLAYHEAGSVFLRAATVPDLEGLSIVVWEIKR